MVNTETQELLQALEKVKATCRKIKGYCTFSLVLFTIVTVLLTVITAMLYANQDQLKVLGVALPELGPRLIIDAILSTSLSLIILLVAHRMFSEIVSKQTPFTNRQVKRLRFLGRSILIYSVVDLLIGLAFYAIELANYYDFFVYHPGDVPPVLISNTNAYVILAGLACYGLAVVFRYGMLLQQLSDDTL